MTRIYPTLYGSKTVRCETWVPPDVMAWVRYQAELRDMPISAFLRSLIMRERDLSVEE